MTVVFKIFFLRFISPKPQEKKKKTNIKHNSHAFLMLWKILKIASGIIQKHWRGREQRLPDRRTMGKTQARFCRWLRFYVRPRSRYKIMPKHTHMCWCAQSWPTLCDPKDSSPPSSSVHGIVQARILEWVAISFSRGSSWPRDGIRVSYVSCIRKKKHP